MDGDRLFRTLERRIRSSRTRVVSFDVLDTAISRTLAAPGDLFILVEARVARATGKPRAFAASRGLAEETARDRVRAAGARHEITLDDIYLVLAEHGFSPAECALYREAEIAAELACCYQVPEIARAWRQAIAAGKIVVFLSDMYLPAEVVARMLRHCGYDAYQYLFVSSETGRTKARGGMFDDVAGRLKQDGHIVSPRQILHVGDNRQSDIASARAHGWRAHHVVAPLPGFRGKGLGGWPLLDYLRGQEPGQATRLAASVTTGLHVQDWLRQGSRPAGLVSWEDVGFRVAGPLLYGFARWLHAQCRLHGHQRLHFLSRDGFIYQRAFDLLAAPLGSRVASSYVYASRRALYLPTITDLDAGAWEILVRSVRPIPVSEFFSRLGLDPASFRTEIEAAFGGMGALVPGHHPELQVLFHRIFPRLRPFIEAQRELAWDYLDHAGLLAGKVAVCDIGYRGSMQAAMARLAALRGADADYTGHYFATFDTRLWSGLRTHGWICQDGEPARSHAALNESVPLLELLFTAQHGTVLGYERDAQGAAAPVLERAAPEEQERFTISANVHAGALRFIQAAIDHDVLDGLDADPAFHLAGWNALVRTPTRPLLRLLATPAHNEGVGASSFVPLLTRVRLWQALLHPRATALAMRRCPWRVGALAAMSWPTRQLVTRVLEPNWRLRHRLRNNPLTRLWQSRPIA